MITFSRPQTSSSSVDSSSSTIKQFNLSSNTNNKYQTNNNNQHDDDSNDESNIEEFNSQKSSSSPPPSSTSSSLHTISRFSKSSSVWFNPVTTIQSLINYSLFLVVVSQLICPVLLPLVLSSFLERQHSVDGSDSFVVSFSVGFENEKKLVTNLNLSATKLIFMLQWLIHIPLVVLPYISLVVNKSYVRESRMMVYWFCILSLFLSNVVVSLKQASFDWISFIPNVLESTDIKWGGEKIVFNRSVPLINKQLETSSILPQLLSLLLFTTITLYFIRDVIFGLNVNFRGRDEIVGLRDFIEREFSICLVSPIQAMLKLTSIDSPLDNVNNTNNTSTQQTQQQPSIISHKETTQNVPSNRDIQSPNSPTEVNVTPSVETSESPRLALSITNTSAKQPTVITKKPIILKEDYDDMSDDDDDDDKDCKLAHLPDKKEKMITKSDKKTASDETSHSPSPSSELPSVSAVLANSENKPHSIMVNATSPTTKTVRVFGQKLKENRLNKTLSITPDTGANINSALEAVANMNRNSKTISEPILIEEETNNHGKSHGEERKRVSFGE